MNAKPNIDAAKAFGSIAFAQGMPAAPALDANMTEMMKGRQIGDKRTIPELKAWHRGWTEANLAAALAA
jgi:hypothetical protein